MNEIKCPNCGKVFRVDEAGLIKKLTKGNPTMQDQFAQAGIKAE